MICDGLVLRGFPCLSFWPCSMQALYKHGILKEKGASGPRINVTMRAHAGLKRVTTSGGQSVVNGTTTGRGKG